MFDLFGPSDASVQRRNQIMQYFMAEQQRQQQEIARQQAATPATPATPAAPNPAVDKEAANKSYREQLLSGLDTEYGPGYSTRTFADTADDPIIDAILGRQRGSAVDAIERAKSRGQLNTSGYNAALGGLDSVGAIGRSEANTLGGGVLSRYRQNIDDQLAQMRSTAGGAIAGSNFDLSPSRQGLATSIGGMQGSLAGDVTAAIGDRNFFDTGKILGTAGAQQGFINPGKVAVAGDTTAEEDKKKKQTNQVF